MHGNASSALPLRRTKFGSWARRPILFQGKSPIGASRLLSCSSRPEGWSADRLSFTSDPFTPAQAWIDAEEVTATQEPDGSTLIKARRNRLLLENKLSIPISNEVRFSPSEDQDSVGNRWAVLVDESDRDGFYVQYSLAKRKVWDRAILSLKPQFMIQRAFEGKQTVILSLAPSQALAMLISRLIRLIFSVWMRALMVIWAMAITG